jgi:anti-anti-sigma factor
MTAKFRPPGVVPEFTMVDIELDDLTQVIALTGEVDFYAAPDFKEHVLAAIAGGKRRLVVDLRNVRLMDSSGIGVLFATLKRLRTLGGQLAIVSDYAEVDSLFEIIGLDDIFAIHRTRHEALRGLD